MVEDPAAARLEMVRQALDTFNEEGVDAWLERYAAPDLVWDMTSIGLGRFVGHDAFREFMKDWTSSYDEWRIERQESELVGADVVLNQGRQGGRMRGSDQAVEFEWAQVLLWEGDRVKQITNYVDFDQARAAAEKLAGES